MWILVRVLIAIVALIARLGFFFFRPEAERVIDGVHRFRRVRKYKGRVTRIDMGLALEGPVFFHLTPESSLDRLFKHLGVAEEIQADDSRFDRRVYIACDHPFLAVILRRNAAARAAILSIFNCGFKRIWTDGHVLWIRTSTHAEISPGSWRLLTNLRESIKTLQSELPHRFKDPFVWKALCIEALTWSIAGYAITAATEYIIVKQDCHLDPDAVMHTGIVAAVVLFVLLLLLIGLVLRKSSRGHRIIIESAILLALSLPVAGIQLVSDLNRGLDRAPSKIETRTIKGVEKRAHRASRGRISYTYHLHLVPSDAPLDEICVTESVFDRAAPEKKLEMVLGPGWLGLPWYRELNIH